LLAELHVSIEGHVTHKTNKTPSCCSK